MIYLFLSILSSALILIIFRWMGRNGSDTRHAIMVNYAVAGLTGILLFLPDWRLISQPWFPLASLLGIFFYLIFRIIAKTTQVNGVAPASIATRMSVILPICIGIGLLHEQVTLGKVIGIFTGLVAVLLTTKTSQASLPKAWIWPLLAFFGSGSVDACLKLFQHFLVRDADFPAFTCTIFLFALLAAVVHHGMLGWQPISRRSIYSGVMLGIVNLGSLFFILKALDLPNWESSVIFPINNVGVIALATTMSIVLFGERLNIWRWFGLALSVVSIVILYTTS